MAQYRLSASIMSRTSGRRVVAAAAYRAGEKLEDRHYGEIHDYGRRRGVVHSEIVLPDNAPEWAEDRAALWSAVENNEKPDNAQLAREIQLSLPCEFTDSQRIALTQEFARHVATEYGLAVDMAIHAPSERGDDRNHHAHLMITTRAFDENRENGWRRAKDRRFDDIAMKRAGERNAVEDLREVWEVLENRALEKADIRDEYGNPVRVDRRSYEERGIEQEPTIKEGVAATELKRSGKDSDRAATNDEIRERNAARREREIIAIQTEAARLEMAELFEAMRQRQPHMLQYERRRREFDTLHDEIKKLLADAERQQKRESNRANELLAATDRRPEQPIVDSQAKREWKPLPGQSQESFEQEMKDRAQQQQSTPKPEYDRNAFGPAPPAPKFDGPKLS